MPIKPTGRAIDSNDLVSGLLSTLLLYYQMVSFLHNVADGIAHLFITVQPSASGNTDKMLCVIKLCNNILSLMC